MRHIQFLNAVLAVVVTLPLAGCPAKVPERKIDFVYLALGASDAAGVGALPLTEGYVYQIKRDLDTRMSGVALLNLGVPGARIDLIKEQARLAQQAKAKANLITIWTGGNDVTHGDDPSAFRADLRRLLELAKDIAPIIVIANLPDLTQLPRFRAQPSPAVTEARVRAFNQAIGDEARRANALLVDLFAQPVQDALVWDVDGFHPNDAGHRELARLFLQQILPALKLRAA
jgi:lysophospholipase L1-like esterase